MVSIPETLQFSSSWNQNPLIVISGSEDSEDKDEDSLYMQNQEFTHTDDEATDFDEGDLSEAGKYYMFSDIKFPINNEN